MPDFGLMTIGHFIYIPFIFTVGLVVGFTLGGRRALAKIEKRAARMKE
jgi:hypothetical protein